MPNPTQTDLLNGMIARLEDANTRAYEQAARGSERPRFERDVGSHSSDQQAFLAAPKRQSSRARRPFLSLVGLILATSVCIAAFAWEPSYGDAVKLIITRWVTAWGPQAVPQAQTISQGGASPPPSLKAEQLLQKLADDLANVEQRIDQLKAGADQIIPQPGGSRRAIRTEPGTSGSRQCQSCRAAQFGARADRSP